MVLSFSSFQSKFTGDTETFFLGLCWRNPFEWINIPKKFWKAHLAPECSRKALKIPISTNFDIFERDMKLTPMWQSRSTVHILWSRGKCLQSPSQKTCRKDIFIENDNKFMLCPSFRRSQMTFDPFLELLQLDLVHWLHFCTNGYDPVLL